MTKVWRSLWLPQMAFPRVLQPKAAPTRKSFAVKRPSLSCAINILAICTFTFHFNVPTLLYTISSSSSFFNASHNDPAPLRKLYIPSFFCPNIVFPHYILSFPNTSLLILLLLPSSTPVPIHLTLFPLPCPPRDFLIHIFPPPPTSLITYSLSSFHLPSLLNLDYTRSLSSFFPIPATVRYLHILPD